MGPSPTTPVQGPVGEGGAEFYPALISIPVSGRSVSAAQPGRAMVMPIKSRKTGFRGAPGARSTELAKHQNRIGTAERERIADGRTQARCCSARLCD